MMARLEPELARRLETLTGEDAACCVRDWKAEAAKLRAGPLADVVLVAKALADENRALALALVERHGEMCACEVQAALGLTHATVSHHMQVLEAAGLVHVERRGKWAYYSRSGKRVTFPAKGEGR